MGSGEGIQRKEQLSAQHQPLPNSPTQLSSSQALIPHTYSYPSIGIDQDVMMNAVFRHSLELQLKEHETFQLQSMIAFPGKIVLLLGTSTAGKSSIIDAYRRKIPDVVEEGVDKTVIHMMFQEAVQQFPDESAIVLAALEPHVPEIAFLNAIYHPEVPLRYKKGITSAEKQGAEQAAQTIKEKMVLKQPDLVRVLLSDVLCNSAQGKQTIFDLVRVEGVFQRILHFPVPLPLQFALCYCPFHELSERMDRRNAKALAEGTPQELRIGPFPLFQFAEFFGPKEKADDPTLEVLHRDTVIADCQKHFRLDMENWKKKDPAEFGEYLHKLEAHYNSKDEKTLIKKEEESVVNDLLKQLGFSSPSIETVEITPRVKTYHLLLNTKLLLPEQSVRQLTGEV